MRFTATLVVMHLVLTACAHGVMSPAGNRIEEGSFIAIGGIDQWVTIRGEDDRKPVLLLLHGGPGDTQSPFASAYAPYEKDFVLVQWDQRGGGRTYEKYGAKTPDLSLERQIADGIELAERLRQRFPRQKLILLGHSWGTILGTGMVQKRGDLFDAYVGAGQVASWADIVRYQYDYHLAAARKAGDADTVTRLEALGALDPTNFAQFRVINRTMRQNMPQADKAWFDGLTSAPGMTTAARRTAADGMNFSGAALMGTLTHVDLTQTAPSFPIPWCIVHGREDLNTPLSAAERYFAVMKAPRKKMMIIEGAGHFALATNAAEFVAALQRCPGV
jgi:proline iminopeptidase